MYRESFFYLNPTERAVVAWKIIFIHITLQMDILTLKLVTNDQSSNISGHFYASIYGNYVEISVTMLIREFF